MLLIDCMNTESQEKAQQYCKDNGIVSGEIVELEVMDLKDYDENGIDYKVLMPSPVYDETVIILFK